LGKAGGAVANTTDSKRSSLNGAGPPEKFRKITPRRSRTHCAESRTIPEARRPKRTASKLCIELCVRTRRNLRSTWRHQPRGSKGQQLKLSHEKRDAVILHRPGSAPDGLKSSPKHLNSCAGPLLVLHSSNSIDKARNHRQALIPERGVRGRQPEGGQKLLVDAFDPRLFNMSKNTVLEPPPGLRLLITQHKSASPSVAKRRRHRRRRASARSGGYMPEGFIARPIYLEHRPKTFRPERHPLGN